MIRSESPPAEIHRKARELLAAEYRTIGDITCANAISTDPDICGREKLAIRAIEAALSLTPPAAAVPDGWRFKRESDGLILVSPPTSGTYGVIAQGKDKLLYALADALLSAAPQPQAEAAPDPRNSGDALAYTLFGIDLAKTQAEATQQNGCGACGDGCTGGQCRLAQESPPAIPEGFTPWGGGECPDEVAKAYDARTHVILRDGTRITSNVWRGHWFNWLRTDSRGIIAYRVEQPATCKPDLQVAEAKAGADDRLAAEHAYTVGAFDYEHNPVGSLDWALFWKGWQAARAQPKPAEGGAVAAWVDKLAEKWAKTMPYAAPLSSWGFKPKHMRTSYCAECGDHLKESDNG